MECPLAGFASKAVVAIPSKRLNLVFGTSDLVEEIEEMIKLRHAEADIRGTDPTIPAFP
jgi:hypothetical protein